jgi:hypothetical protein
LRDEESGTKVVQGTKGDGGQSATSSFYYIIQIQIVLISEIEDVSSRYVVPYTGKRHNTSQAEIDAFQNINMK